MQKDKTVTGPLFSRDDDGFFNTFCPISLICLYFGSYDSALLFYFDTKQGGVSSVIGGVKGYAVDVGKAEHQTVINRVKLYGF